MVGFIGHASTANGQSVGMGSIPFASKVARIIHRLFHGKNLKGRVAAHMVSQFRVSYSETYYVLLKAINHVDDIGKQGTS
jgi:hypothetical protein